MSDTVDCFEKIVRGRRSVRAFTDQVIPDVELKTIFELAQRAPSNCNTQPWQTVVVSGGKCRELSQKFTEAMFSGQSAFDFPYDGVYDGVYRERQVDAARQLYGAMGIAREDKDGRNAAFFRNFEFFDAPHAAFLFLPDEFGIREAADLGMYAQTLMLALQAYGYASCPMTALSFQADLIREFCDVPENLKLLFGIVFGTEDASAKANDARTARCELGDAVKFIE